MPLVHRWGEVGRPPGNRTLPFPVICQVSQAYKARPLPRAADTNWCVRWDLNPQRQRSQHCAYTDSATNANRLPERIRTSGAAPRMHGCVHHRYLTLRYLDTPTGLAPA